MRLDSHRTQLYPAYCGLLYVCQITFVWPKDTTTTVTTTTTTTTTATAAATTAATAAATAATVLLLLLWVMPLRQS